MVLVLQMEEKQLMVIFNYSYEMEKNSNFFKDIAVALDKATFILVIIYLPYFAMLTRKKVNQIPKLCSLKSVYPKKVAKNIKNQVRFFTPRSFRMISQ